MRFALIETDYPKFTSWLIAQHPELESRTYDEQVSARAESLFGAADFYSSNLRALGHEAQDIHFGNALMQRTWLNESGLPGQDTSSEAGPHLSSGSIRRLIQRGARTRLSYLIPLVSPFLRPRYSRDRSWQLDALVSQIAEYDPDVVINFALGSVPGSMLRELLPEGRLLVGQIASALPSEGDFESYDLILSSLPNMVSHFQKLGIKAELHRLAFEPRVLDMLESGDRDIPVSFAGSISKAHGSRTEFIEHLCKLPEFQIWGLLSDGVGNNSEIRRRHQGTAWGIEMYRVLARSRITVNHHIDIAGDYANNMRLFEATGVGALLITDWKENLHEMFELEKEVVAFRSPEECVELVRYYLEHDDERETIARAGQKRTLTQHTYRQRMEELITILQPYLQPAKSWN